MPIRVTPRARAETPAFDAERLARANQLCDEATRSGRIPGMALVVARHGRTILNEAWGYTDTARTRPATQDTIWLTASVTKPVVCSGISLLLERGALALDDAVHRYIPEFAGEDRAGVTLRHLLTHTSGLPDMLPENVALRKRHAPMEEFIRRICTTPLLFEPGTEIKYQSTGIALLAEVIQRVTGMPCRDFLREEFFLPLGMHGTALGWRPEFADRASACFLPDDHAPTDWDWNSSYWRELGAPWGGILAPASEIATFFQMILHGGLWDGRRYLAPATVAASLRNQTEALPRLAASAKVRESWGLGWQLASPGRRDYFGDLSSPASYGHLGSTGTGAWNDPESGVTFVLFTNRPECWRFIGLVSSVVAGAVL